MPTYEYHCSHCHRLFDVFQKITDPPLAVCPTCHQPVKRLVSAASFSLQGSGWYKDGYSKPSSSPDASSKKEEQKPAADPGGKKASS